MHIKNQIVFFFGAGQLGNQVFQYVFLKTHFPNSLIISNNLNELSSLFSGIRKVINIGNGRKLKIVKRLAHLAVSARLIGLVNVKKKELNNHLIEENIGGFEYQKRGLFPIVLLEPFFAQSEKMFSTESAHLKIKDEFEAKADSILRELSLENSVKGFVHVRRGDYLQHKIFDKHNVILPINYYLKCINKIHEEYDKNLFWLFLTDDVKFVEECFQDVSNKVVLSNDKYIDFVLMTKCQFGILSNSSFSWWASYFMKDRKLVLFPTYWMGWEIEFEYPVNVSPSWGEALNIGHQYHE